MRPDQCGSGGQPLDPGDAEVIRRFGVWLEARAARRGYPPLPIHPPADAQLARVWDAAWDHETRIDALIWGEWPCCRELTTGPAPDLCGDPTCRDFEWDEAGDHNGPFLVCLAHWLPAPGWAYQIEYDWPIGDRGTR